MLFIPLFVILILAVIVVAAVVGIYNRLVTNRNRYQNAYAQIDVQLKRRYDLIPNLVETAKGYIAHERGTLEAVTQARTAAVGAAQAAAAKPGDPGAMQALAGAEGALTTALGRLFAVVEAYPNLKANETMMRLMEELTSTENRIAFSRQAYNDSVQAYNISRETFPAVLLAGMLGFNPASLLESTESPEERKAPKVSFS
jgi:LemA protein